MSDNDHDHPAKPDAAYEVGYGKPPKASRFKPGQSGNPKGRKKGKKSPARLLKEILDEKITVIEGQVEKKYSRLEAVFRQTVARTLKGEAKAASTLFAITKAVGYIEPEPDETDAKTAQALAEEDREVMATYFARSS